MSRPIFDGTSRDAESLRQDLLALAREKLPLWTDHSPNDLGVVLLEAFAYLGDQLFYHQDRIATESYLDTALEPRSVVHLLRLIGYELEPSKPAAADLQLFFDAEQVAKLTEQGAIPPVVIPSGAEFQTTRETAGEVIRFRYLGPDLEIVLGTAQAPAQDVVVLEESGGRQLLRWGLLPVRQVDLNVTRQIIGSSDGSAGQRFVLAHTPLIDDSLHVFVREGEAVVEWQRQSTLLFSSPTDRHYQVRRDEDERAFIEFGTGTQGRVPPHGVDNVLTTYLVGGGQRGNVAPNTIVKLGEGAEKIPGLRRAGHQEPASGGADREELPVAAQRAPQQFRSQDRAVTPSDYEAHALELGVAKARAFAGAWNRVDLFIAPAGGGLPSKTLKEQILRHLDERRVLTTVVQVKDPVYVDVFVEAHLTVEPTYFTEKVKYAADQAIRQLLAFDQVDFQEVLYVSKLYEAVEAIEGVRGLVIDAFTRADAVESSGRLEFGEREIPVLSRLKWTVEGGLSFG